MFGFAPQVSPEQEAALQEYLWERRMEFIREAPTLPITYVILEGELDRLVTEFLRGANRLN